MIFFFPSLKYWKPSGKDFVLWLGTTNQKPKYDPFAELHSWRCIQFCVPHPSDRRHNSRKEHSRKPEGSSERTPTNVGGYIFLYIWARPPLLFSPPFTPSESVK